MCIRDQKCVSILDESRLPTLWHRNYVNSAWFEFRCMWRKSPWCDWQKSTIKCFVKANSSKYQNIFLIDMQNIKQRAPINWNIVRGGYWSHNQQSIKYLTATVNEHQISTPNKHFIHRNLANEKSVAERGQVMFSFAQISLTLRVNWFYIHVQLIKDDINVRSNTVDQNPPSYSTYIL